jgi:hypothetical protein
VAEGVLSWIWAHSDKYNEITKCARNCARDGRLHGNVVDACVKTRKAENYVLRTKEVLKKESIRAKFRDLVIS